MKKFLNIENLTLFGLIAGILGGIFFPEIMKNFKILGDIFLALLKMIIIPLVFTSVLVAMLGLGDIGKFGNLGFKTFIYYMITTGLSVLIGIILVISLEPGKGEKIIHTIHHTSTPHQLSLKDLIWSIFPTNPIKSFVEGRVLQIIFFSILLGLAILKINKAKIKNLYQFFDGLNDAFIVLTKWIIKLTPIGVFGLVGYIVAISGYNVLFSLWKYIITVILGLLIHAFLILPLLAFIVGGYNPYKYFYQVREAILLAFSTASSAATLPVSLQVSEEKGKISKEVAGFVLPLGATINMDGTALYESVAAVFIANLFGIKLTSGQIFIIFLTSTLASIGAAAIPGAGLVMLTLVLSSVGIPLEGIGITMAVDRFLDMIRTSVNVWGDLNCAKILDKII